MKSANGHKISLRKYESVDVYDFNSLPPKYLVEKIQEIVENKKQELGK